jgi:CrcB protein
MSRFLPEEFMLWYVAAGSAVGGAARFLLASFIQQRAGPSFPIGTLIVNVTGSLVLGFIMRLALSTASISPEMRTMLTTGFCGGYTTFSTFSYETMMLIEEGQYARGAVYVLLSVVLSLIGVWLGIVAARELVALRTR